MANPYIFVYQTTNKVNGKSYVGVHSTNNIEDGYIGCGIFAERDARRNMLFHKAVRKHGYHSFERHILSFYDTYEEALSEEKFIVHEKWVKDKNNYNTAIGGEGNTTSWMNEEQKNKWKSNISEATKKWVNEFGYERLKEIVTKNLKQPKGEDHPFYGVPSIRRRKVDQFNINGQFIKSHNSIHEAAKEVGSVISSITLCCQGKYRTCKGFVFRYVNFSNEEKLNLENNLSYKPGLKRKIVQFDNNGNIIKEYLSQPEAAKNIGCSVVLVHKHLKGKIEFCKGYKLGYKDEIK